MRKLMVQAVCVVALVPVSIAAPAGPAMASSADPCAGLTHCTEAPPIDITGDGKPDRLAYRFVNRPTDEPWNARAKVDVIVVSATGQRYTYAYRAEGFLAGTYGAAPLDGVPGTEIALAALPGAHTYWITVITFRNGRLVSEKGPSNGSGAGTWAVDGGGPQYGSGIGLVRGTAGGSPRLEGCGYTAMGSQGTEGPVRAVFAPYQWRQGRWVALPAIEQDFATGSALPRHCGAWVVPGMRTLPTDLPEEIASGSGARVRAHAWGRPRAGTEVKTEAARGVEPRSPAPTTPTRRSTRCTRADGGPTAADHGEDDAGTARMERPATTACPSMRSPVTRTRSAPPWFSGSAGRVASEGFLLLANTVRCIKDLGHVLS